MSGQQIRSGIHLMPVEPLGNGHHGNSNLSCAGLMQSLVTEIGFSIMEALRAWIRDQKGRRASENTALSFCPCAGLNPVWQHGRHLLLTVRLLHLRSRWHKVCDWNKIHQILRCCENCKIHQKICLQALCFWDVHINKDKNNFHTPRSKQFSQFNFSLQYKNVDVGRWQMPEMPAVCKNSENIFFLQKKQSWPHLCSSIRDQRTRR